MSLHLWRVPRRILHHPTSRRFIQSNTPSGTTSDVPAASWSIKELLQSYPAPKVDDKTLNRLHKLAALKPPKAGSEEFESLRRELEDMIRLVEAVKTIEIPDTPATGTFDGRVWPDSQGLQFDDSIAESHGKKAPHGRDLLKHSSAANDEFYLVELAKR